MNQNIDDDRFTPDEAEKKNGMIVKNVMRCGICGANADRFQYNFRCQSNPGHVADFYVGIWSDLSRDSD